VAQDVRDLAAEDEMNLELLDGCREELPELDWVMAHEGLVRASKSL
jgi:hypothetical protein